MELYLNLPRDKKTVRLCDPISNRPIQGSGAKIFTFYPDKPTEVTDEIGKRLLEQEKATGILSEKPFDDSAHRAKLEEINPALKAERLERENKELQARLGNKGVSDLELTEATNAELKSRIPKPSAPADAPAAKKPARKPAAKK